MQKVETTLLNRFCGICKRRATLQCDTDDERKYFCTCGATETISKGDPTHSPRAWWYHGWKAPQL